MPIGSSLGDMYKDSYEMESALHKKNSDASEMALNETSGDFQSRFYATDQSTMPLGASTELTGALKDKAGSMVPETPPNEIKEGLAPAKPSTFLDRLSVVNAVKGMAAGSEDAVLNFPKNFKEGFQSVINTLKIPGEVAQGKLPMWATDAEGNVQTNHQVVEKATDLALLTMGAPAPVVARAVDGTLGTMAGVRSQTVPKTKAYNAQTMEMEGYSSDAIHEATGFHKGLDGQWKYEISDAKAKFKPNGMDRNVEVTKNPSGWASPHNDGELHVTVSPKKGGARLDEVLDHPDLFEAYPLLKDIKVKPMPPGMPDSVKGQMSGNTLHIRDNLDPEYAKGIIMHEVQHRIQVVEGFSRGGSKGEFLPKEIPAAIKEFESVKAEIEPQIKEALKMNDKGYQNTKNAMRMVQEGNAPEAIRDQIARLRFLDPISYRRLDNIVHSEKLLREADEQAFTNYQNLAGEVEARNVQARLNYTEAERRAIPPQATEDRPRAAQIPLGPREFIAQSGGAGLQYGMLGDIWDKLGVKGPSSTPIPSDGNLKEYPTEKDAENAIKYGFGYGSGKENYINAETAQILGMNKPNGEFNKMAGTTMGEDNIVSRLYDENVNLTKLKNLGERKAVGTSMAQAALAINRNPVAAIGFKPEKILLDIASGRNVNMAGFTDPANDNLIYANAHPELRSAIVHESIHAGLNEMYNKIPEAKAIMDETGFRTRTNESLVRYMMYKYAGDPEGQKGVTAKEQRDAAVALFKYVPDLGVKAEKLMDIAATYLKDKRPGGPR